MSNNVEELKSCQRAADSLNVAVTTNVEISKFNTEQSQRAAAALSTWENRKREREQSQRDWDNRRDQIKSDKEKEDREAGCGGCGTNQNCDQAHGSGWNWNRTDRCGLWNAQCKFICRRSGDLAFREANDQIRNERGDRPGDFNESKPVDKQGDFYHKELIQLENIGINCCSNSINTADQSNVLNVIQKCQQEINQKITSSLETDQKINSSSSTSLPQQSEEKKSLTSTWWSNQKTDVFTAGFILYMFICSCICIMFLVLLL